MQSMHDTLTLNVTALEQGNVVVENFGVAYIQYVPSYILFPSRRIRIRVQLALGLLYFHAS